MGQWKVVHGMLVSDGSEDSASVAPVDLGNVSDYAVEVEMQVIDPKTGQYYVEARLISGEGYFGGYKGAYSSWDRAMRIGFGSSVISGIEYTTDSEWHTYRLEVYGNNIRLLYDGAELVRGIDNRQLEPGIVGVYASGQVNVRAFRVIAL